jgi:hypothetical protein
MPCPLRDAAIPPRQGNFSFFAAKFAAIFVSLTVGSGKNLLLVSFFVRNRKKLFARDEKTCGQSIKTKIFLPRICFRIETSRKHF